jgi:hypothetical protein
MAHKTMDFDAFWHESKQDTVTITIMGKTYTLPGTVPVGMVMRYMRMEQSKLEGDANSPEFFLSAISEGGMMREIIDGLFGAGTMQDWIDRNITFEQLTDIIQYVASGYGAQVQAPESAGEEASAVPLTSSSTGRPSRRTSVANTK